MQFLPVGEGRGNFPNESLWVYKQTEQPSLQFSQTINGEIVKKHQNQHDQHGMILEATVK